MICTKASFPTPQDARVARREYLRNYHLAVSVQLCEQCDAFHLQANVSQLKVPKNALKVLRLIALGYTAREISERCELSVRTTEWYIEELKHVFNAMSLAHLVATAIALGVINPNEFIPPLIDRNHDGRNGSGNGRNPAENSLRQAVQ